MDAAAHAGNRPELNGAVTAVVQRALQVRHAEDPWVSHKTSADEQKHPVLLHVNR